MVVIASWLGVNYSSPLGVHASNASAFAAPATLLLKASALPRGFRYRGYFVQSSVARWDGNIPPIVAIDEKNGWLSGAQESALDTKGYHAMISVQLFFSPAGARSDFGQFFTNAHPQSRFVPDTYWLGGKAVRGMGDRATLYHILDNTSHCPAHLSVGVSFVFRNGIFSAGGCARTLGDAGALDLGHRLLQRARKVAGRT